MAQHRVLIAGVDDSAGDLRRALTSVGAGLEVEVIEYHAAAARSGGFDGNRPVAVFVIGPHVTEPLTVAEQFRQHSPRAQIVFLLAAHRIEKFRASLPFVPHLSDAWTALINAPAEGTRSVILEAARAAHGRDALLSVFDRINAQLASSSAGAEAQRRRRQISLSEKYLATVLRQAPDAIFALDLNGMIIATNDAAARLFGLSADDAIGRPAVHLFAPQVQEEVDALLERGRAGEVIISRETLILPASGTPAHAELRMAPIRDDDVQIVGLAVTARDITERKRAEIERQRLIELEDTLRQIQKMETLGQLTGGIAHDFKNLLMLITGNLEIIEGAVPRDDDMVRRALERARVGADRAAALTQRLLAFSRQQTLDPKPVQINELLSSMADIWRQALDDAIRLDIDIPQKSPTIFVDPNQLENAVLNLILNARDASNPGTRIKVVSEVMFVDTPTLGRTGEMTVGEYASISVEDQGSGIPNELLDRIFEPLFTTKPVGQGTGLGLSMVYGFVKQSKGYIDITSAPERGTTVRLIFPSFRQSTVD